MYFYTSLGFVNIEAKPRSVSWFGCGWISQNCKDELKAVARKCK